MFAHKKSANMSQFSLIILMEMSECWEALFLSNLNIPFLEADLGLLQHPRWNAL